MSNINPIMNYTNNTRNMNPTDTLIIYATMTMASLLRKYQRLEEESRYNDNVLTERVMEINRLSGLVDKLDRVCDDDVFQATLIMNNSGLSFNTKLKKLKKLKFDTIEKLEKAKRVSKGTGAPANQNVGQGVALGALRGPAAAAVAANVEQAVAALGDISGDEKYGQLAGIVKGLADVKAKQDEFMNRFGSQKKRGGAQPLNIRKLQQPTRQNGKNEVSFKEIEKYADEHLKDIELIQDYDKSLKFFLEENELEIDRLKSEIDKKAQAGGAVAGPVPVAVQVVKTPEERLATAEAVRGVLHAIKGMSSEILDKTYDQAAIYVQLFADNLPKNAAALSGEIAKLKTDIQLATDKWEKDSKILAKKTSEIANKTSSAGEKASVINIGAVNEVLGNAAEIIGVGSEFNAAISAGVGVNAGIKNAARALDSGAGRNINNKNDIERVRATTTGLKAEAVKNILADEVRKKDEESVLLVNLDDLEWNAAAVAGAGAGGVQVSPPGPPLEGKGAANVLYQYATKDPNQNANAGTYAACLFNNARSEGAAANTGNSAVATAALPKPVSINVAARMGGVMYAINKRISYATCGDVAVKAVVGFLTDVAEEHLQAPAVAVVGGPHVAAPVMGVPSYPDGVAAGPAGFPAGPARPLAPPLAKTVALAIAEAIANGKSVADVKRDVKNGVDALDHPRIDFVVRELMEDSAYLAGLIAAAVGAPLATGVIATAGNIANVRVVDNDVYYTVINVATSVYASTGNAETAVKTGRAVGKLMVMFKYGHSDLVRVTDNVPAYLGIYVTIALAMLGKSPAIAAKTGFVFGQGLQHHENVSASLALAFAAPDKLVRFRPTLVGGAVGGGVAALGAAGGGALAGVPNNIIGQYINAYGAGAGNAIETDLVLATAVAEIVPVSQEQNNPAYINAPLLYRSVRTANNKLSELRRISDAAAAAAAQFRDQPDGANPANVPPFGAGARQLNGGEKDELKDAASDAYETAKRAARYDGALGVPGAPAAFDISDVRMIFKLFHRIIASGPVGAPQTINIIDSNNSPPYARNANLDGVIRAGGAGAPALARVIRLTPRAPRLVAGLPVLTNNRIDTVSDLLFRPPIQNGISYYEVRSPVGPDGEFNDLVNLTDKQVNLIQYFMAFRVPDWIAGAPNVGAPPNAVPGLLPRINHDNLQRDIFLFSAMNFAQNNGTGWDLDTATSCHVGRSIATNWKSAINNYKALHLLSGKDVPQSIKDDIGSTFEEYKNIDGLIDTGKTIESNLKLEKAIEGFKKYSDTVTKTADAISPYNGNARDKIASNTAAAIQLSADAVLKTLEASENIFTSAGFESARVANSKGKQTKEDVDKLLNDALDKISEALNNTGRFPAFGGLSADEAGKVYEKIKTLINEVKSETNSTSRLVKAEELLAAVQLTTNVYASYNEADCKMLSAGERIAAGAPAEVVAPDNAHNKLDTVLSAVKAVTTAIKTVATSEKVLIAAQLKESAEYIDEKKLNAAHNDMKKSITTIRKTLDQLNADNQNGVRNSGAIKTLESNLRNLDEQAAAQLDDKRRFNRYHQYLKALLDSNKNPLVANSSTIKQSIEEIRTALEDQTKSLDTSTNDIKNIVGPIWGQSAGLLALAK